MTESPIRYILELAPTLIINLSRYFYFDNTFCYEVQNQVRHLKPLIIISSRPHLYSSFFLLDFPFFFSQNLLMSSLKTPRSIRD